MRILHVRTVHGRMRIIMVHEPPPPPPPCPLRHSMVNSNAARRLQGRRSCCASRLIKAAYRERRAHDPFKFEFATTVLTQTPSRLRRVVTLDCCDQVRSNHGIAWTLSSAMALGGLGCRHVVACRSSEARAHRLRNSGCVDVFFRPRGPILSIHTFEFCLQR